MNSVVVKRVGRLRKNLHYSPEIHYWRKHDDTQNQIRYSFASLIATLGVLCVAPKAEAACTAATIEGSYGFRFDGFVGPSSGVARKVGAFVPEAVVGEISFTATSSTGGTLTGSESGNYGGGVFQLTFPGTYTVNARKCTGSLTRTLFEGFTVTDDFVIVKGGDEIEFASTTAGIVEAGVMKREGD